MTKMSKKTQSNQLCQILLIHPIRWKGLRLNAEFGKWEVIGVSGCFMVLVAVVSICFHLWLFFVHAWGILVPWQGLNLCPLQWKHQSPNHCSENTSGWLIVLLAIVRMSFHLWFFFWGGCVFHILVPWQGLNLCLLQWNWTSPNHWTTREFPMIFF